jgi:hypothetical protein
MHNRPLLLASAALWSVATLAVAGPPPHGGGRYGGAPGAYPGAAFRPVYPGYRPIYPGWGAGYWGPRAGVYVGGPGYWGAWPYAWGAGYAVPYAVAPLVVNAAPAAQVYVQQEPAAAAPAPSLPDSSYWYYCTQPAGYFPYVQDCSHAWMKVVPQVPGATTTPPRLAP